MICSKCGKENEEGVKICVSCGTQLEAGQACAERKDDNISQTTAFKTCKKAKTSFWVSLIGIIIAGIVCGAYAMTCGIQALKEIDADKKLRGKGLAVAGITIGVFDIVFSIVSILLLF